MAIALVVTGAAYALAGLGQTSQLPVDIGPFLAVIAALLLVAHLAMRRLAPDATPILLPIAALLNGLGYVVIAGLDPELAGLQATWTALGVAAFVATLAVVRKPRSLERYRYTFALVGIALVMLPFVPGVGRSTNGARIWVEVGPVSFQPGEVAKIVFAIFMASYLIEKRELLRERTWRLGPLHLPEPKYFGPLLVAWGISLVVMISQKDLGSSLLFFSLFVVLLWVATEQSGWLIVGAALFAFGAYIAWTQFGHVQDRVDIWLDPWADPDDKGYQIVQAAFAMSIGGLTGTGLGLGGAVRIPYAETDFVFAVIAEELGLVGATMVVCSYLLIVGTGLRIAIRARDGFEKLLATGLTSLIGLQAFVIMGGVIRVLPLTGVTLPFVSYGGSSLVANFVLIALLLRISDGSEHPARPSRVERFASPGAGDQP